MNEKKIIDIKSIFKNKNLDSKEIKLKAEKLMKKNITAMKYLQDK
ncbi:hypothetical protein [Fusobacterium mortiferum]|jgi:hypothetical protein|nr:hypothetical protein [Fusobacterium mortiferum]